jgi:hypothetical protein
VSLVVGEGSTRKRFISLLARGSLTRWTRRDRPQLRSPFHSLPPSRTRRLTLTGLDLDEILLAERLAGDGVPAVLVFERGGEGEEESRSRFSMPCRLSSRQAQSALTDILLNQTTLVDVTRLGDDGVDRRRAGDWRRRAKERRKREG